MGRTGREWAGLGRTGREWAGRVMTNTTSMATFGASGCNNESYTGRTLYGLYSYVHSTVRIVLSSVPLTPLLTDVTERVCPSPCCLPVCVALNTSLPIPRIELSLAPTPTPRSPLPSSPEIPKRCKSRFTSLIFRRWRVIRLGSCRCARVLLTN